jgi:hypothetical protein
LIRLNADREQAKNRNHAKGGDTQSKRHLDE